MNEEPTEQDLWRLWETCAGWVRKNQVHCGEDLGQSDRVILEFPSLAWEVCEVVGFVPYEA